MENSLPIKTKISAWLMIGWSIIGIVAIITGWEKIILYFIGLCGGLIEDIDINPVDSFIHGVLDGLLKTWLFLSLCILLSGIFLNYRKKLGWIIGIVSLLFLLISLLFYHLFPSFSRCIISETLPTGWQITYWMLSLFLLIFLFILLLLDRKNFFRIAR